VYLFVHSHMEIFSFASQRACFLNLSDSDKELRQRWCITTRNLLMRLIRTKVQCEHAIFLINSLVKISRPSDSTGTKPRSLIRADHIFHSSSLPHSPSCLSQARRDFYLNLLFVLSHTFTFTLMESC